MTALCASLAVLAVGGYATAWWQFRRAERLAELYFGADTLRSSYLRRIGELEAALANARRAGRDV